MNFTPEQITAQICALDEEARIKDSDFVQSCDNLARAVYASKVSTIIKADPCFRLGIQVGYRLAEANIMNNMTKDEAGE